MNARGPKHKDSFPSPVDLSITPLPPYNPLQEHILRQGLAKNMPMQPPQSNHLQYKRPSFHPSGAETDTDLPARKKTRSPPRTPTQDSPGLGQIRRGNSFNTPPAQNKGFIPGSDLGLLGLAALAGARARSAMGEAKKEEAIDVDERHGHGRHNSPGGLLDGSSSLSFTSNITDEQWRQINERGAEGDDEESDSGEGRIIMHREEPGWVGEGARTIGLGPGFSGGSGGLGRAKNVLQTGVGQGQGGYKGLTGGNIGLNTRQGQQKQPLSQLDDTIDFTDNFTETDGGDYGDYDTTGYQDGSGGDHDRYSTNQGTHVQYNEHPSSPARGQLGPDHPPVGNVYRPRSPSPSEIDYPDSPTLSNASPESIEDILSLPFSQENHAKRWAFFRQCTPEEWARYGDVILQRQAELAKEMMKSRAARKEAVRAFEEELSTWEGEVDGHMDRARQYMARMKTNFEMLKVG